MKIKFIENKEFLKETTILPTSAKNNLPDWFKKTPHLMNNDKNFKLLPSNHGYFTNSTIKKCVPFLDALTMGYFIYLDSDVLFEFNDNNNVSMKWRTESDLIYNQEEQQHEKMPIPIHGHEEPLIYKWVNNWKIQTPKGYSVYFTHPVNRYDLPFLTYSGVVDTDIYPNPVVFPFSILKPTQKNFILKKNTPIVQVIPFKRDNWNLEIENFNLKQAKKDHYMFFSNLKTSYKSNFWKRKKFN